MIFDRTLWGNVPLNSICEIKRGNIITKNDIRKGKIPVIASAVGVTYYHDTANIFDEVITVSSSGVNAGFVNFHATPIYASDCITVQTSTKRAILTFIFLYLKFSQKRIMSFQRGTAQPHVYPKDLNDFPIPLPTLEEQQRIVELFQSIENCHKLADDQEKNFIELKTKLLRDTFSEPYQLGTLLSSEEYKDVYFRDICENVSERVEPNKTELEIYVGLEHLDSEDLKIRRWGKPSDVIGTKLKFYKGDIIFGKRRAYLRKLAVADFDGIASAHSMVLRARTEKIQNSLLPFLMQSDEFMVRAVQISEGSLSPTIKWNTLSQQKFRIPKIDKQNELILLFKNIDECREQIIDQKTTLQQLKHKLLNEILG